MAEWNLIKLNQIDDLQLGAFISGIASGQFANLLSSFVGTGGSLGNSVVYTTNVNQTISGTKTFTSSISVPYTGTTGQTVARKYVDDLFNLITGVVAPLSGAQLVFRSGDQVISGNKTFAGTYLAANYIARSGFGTAGYGINISASALINSGGAQTLDWNTKNLYGTWSFDTIPTIGGAQPVLTSTNQTINGIKTFAGEVVVPTAVNAFNPVPFNQFRSELTATGQSLQSLLALGATGSTSGFAGVASINGISGHIFTQGRGTVTIWQQGNILNVSGDLGATGDVQSVLGLGRFDLASGQATQRINFSQPYTLAPFVFAQLGTVTGYPNYAYQISGVDPTGFSLVLSDSLPNTGYFVNYLAVEQSGLITTLRGEQGQQGLSLTPKGSWTSGALYSYLDFVNISGISWVSKSGHFADFVNHPVGVSGSTYWNILASGSGPKGDNGIIFAFTGPWDQGATYQSGEAVTFSGASYGATGTSSAGTLPTGIPWVTIAERGGVGLSFTFKGEFNSGVNYSGGDVVAMNGGTYVLPINQNSSGLVTNPVSSNSVWEQLTPRAITFNADYDANSIYYKNDLANSSTGYGVTAEAQYIWTENSPIVGFHPNGYYNVFTDCSGVTGYNVFELNLTTKTAYSPDFGLGSTSEFTFNLESRNFEGSGFDTLVLVRDFAYFFDNELTGTSFILSETPLGGNFTDQYVSEVTTGRRLLVDENAYEAMGFNQALFSGTMRFVPRSGTPDDLYIVSPTATHRGWHLKIVDENPWKVFTSGIQGPAGVGATGATGAAGLAFVWKGTWSNLLGYASGNAVYYNGSSYATNQAVTGSSPEAAPWFLIARKGADGEDAKGLAFDWKGNWSSVVQYQPDEAVYYNGSSYATTGIPPVNYNPIDHPEYWFTIAKSGTVGPQGQPGTGIGFSWRGDFSPSRTYVSGDAVYYNGSSYGTTGSSSGVLPNTGATWNTIAQGGGVIMNWRHAWDANTTYYSGDAVSYLGSSYACFTENYNAAPAISPSIWEVIAKKGDTGPIGPTGAIGPKGSGGLAFEWRGTWNNTFDYVPRDAVYFNGNSYGTNATITGVDKFVIPESSANWFLIAKKGDPGLAFTWKGVWNTNTLYRPYESVSYSGRSYATITFAASGTKPGTAPWFVIADKGDVFINQSYYAGNSTPVMGSAIWETFIGKPTAFTGFSWGLAAASTMGENISGRIYKRTIVGSTPTLFDFVVTTGLVIYWSGNANVTVNRMERLGIDLSGGAGTDAIGLSIGIFGNAPSD
jgi:hypothetical protein